MTLHLRPPYSESGLLQKEKHSNRGKTSVDKGAKCILTELLPLPLADIKIFLLYYYGFSYSLRFLFYFAHHAHSIYQDFSVVLLKKFEQDEF